jgi:hypothetical protein
MEKINLVLLLLVRARPGNGKKTENWEEVLMDSISLTPLYADLLSEIAPSPAWADHPLFLQWLECRHSLSEADYLTLLNYLQRCYARAVIIRLSSHSTGDNR